MSDQFIVAMVALGLLTGLYTFLILEMRRGKD